MLAEPFLRQQADCSIAERHERFAAIERREQSRQRGVLIVVGHVAVQLEPVDPGGDVQRGEGGRPSIDPSRGFHVPPITEQLPGDAGQQGRGELQRGLAGLMVPLGADAPFEQHIHGSPLGIRVATNCARRAGGANDRAGRFWSDQRAVVLERDLGDEPVGSKGRRPEAKVRSRLSRDRFDAEIVRQRGQQRPERQQRVDELVAGFGWNGHAAGALQRFQPRERTAVVQDCGVRFREQHPVVQQQRIGQLHPLVVPPQPAFDRVPAGGFIRDVIHADGERPRCAVIPGDRRE